MYKFILLILFVSLFVSFYTTDDGEIMRMNKPSVSAKIVKAIPHVIQFNDTIPNDTLWEYVSGKNIPVMYSREIATSVCSKGECRPVLVTLFWNCTGSYLGYKLPQGEFLSKTEHVKFGDKDYDRLHQLLGNRQSALATYTYQDLAVNRDTVKNGVDAVTSATLAALLDYIVEGAVYTTYTLWHVVYGHTKREIEKQTVAKLTPDLTHDLLNSDISEDRIWILNHFSKTMEITPQLQSKLIEFISGKDVYLAERSLNALSADQLSDSVQIKLSGIFKNTGLIQKRFILQKLNETSSLNNLVALSLSAELQNLSVSLVKQVLELFTRNDVDNENVSENISVLLNNNNRNISKLAFNYLENSSNINRKTQKRIEKFRKNM